MPTISLKTPREKVIAKGIYAFNQVAKVTYEKTLTEKVMDSTQEAYKYTFTIHLASKPSQEPQYVPSYVLVLQDDHLSINELDDKGKALNTYRDTSLCENEPDNLTRLVKSSGSALKMLEGAASLMLYDYADLLQHPQTFEALAKIREGLYLAAQINKLARDALEIQKRSIKNGEVELRKQ